jgi:hypothetical protein
MFESMEALKDMSFGAMFVSAIILGLYTGVRGFWDEDQKMCRREGWD